MVGNGGEMVQRDTVDISGGGSTFSLLPSPLSSTILWLWVLLHPPRGSQHELAAPQNSDQSNTNPFSRFCERNMQSFDVHLLQSTVYQFLFSLLISIYPLTVCNGLYTVFVYTKFEYVCVYIMYKLIEVCRGTMMYDMCLVKAQFIKAKQPCSVFATEPVTGCYYSDVLFSKDGE